MSKKIFVALALLLPLIANAETLAPLPTKGLTVIPLAKTNIPEELKQHILQVKADQDKNGYYESTDKDLYVRHLLQMKRTARSEITSFKNVNNVYDTHLKENLSDVALAFTFKPIKLADDASIIGYAPVGSYIKGKKPSEAGWTGIGVFFTDAKLGTCAYTFFNLKLSHGAAQLNTETTQYLVNKKASSITIEGNQNTGFLYDLIWFTPETMSQLQCANKMFDREKLTKMITLGSAIDKR